MSDLVQRLRHYQEFGYDPADSTTLDQAADEIERLQQAFDQSRVYYHMAAAKRLSMESAYQAEIERLRAGLVKFGQHEFDCRAQKNGLRDAYCDCGLAELRKAST